MSNGALSDGISLLEIECIAIRETIDNLIDTLHGKINTREFNDEERALIKIQVSTLQAYISAIERRLELLRLKRHASTFKAP